MSALITVDQLSEYTGNYEDVAYKETIVGAASSVVEQYLRYSPLTQTRKYSLVSWGTDSIMLPVPNATEVGSVTVNGEVYPESAYHLNQRYLFGEVCFNNWVPRGARVVIEYTAGWAEIPSIIQLAVLRIASLMLEEANGNIGVTQKSFADMSKTFVNYANYDKYLKPLALYRAGVV